MVEGEWQTVNRRKGGSSSNTTTTKVQPFIPFHTQPTYVDMVRRTTSNSGKSTTTTPTNSSPRIPTSTAFYISPHSHSNPRFPLSAKYVEWKGRCFNCCRMGHNVAHCRNPKRCGKCWGEGHVGSRCGKAIEPVARPPCPVEQQGIDRRREPSFDDLLAEPIIAKPLPDGRPKKLVCFVERDDEYFDELAKLDGAVIMHNPNLEIDLTLEEVATFASQTNLVSPGDFSGYYDEIKICHYAPSWIIPRGIH